MSINITYLKEIIKQKIDISTSAMDIASLSTALLKLKDNIINSSASVAELPNPIYAKGQLWFVINTNIIYWSDGIQWIELYLGSIFPAKIFSFGKNNFGQLGDNTSVSKSSPISVVGDFIWKQVSSGYNHDTAIKSDDTIWAWGLNASGQLGNNVGTTSSRSSPVLVVGGFLWRQVSTGTNYTAAIKSDNTLWTWGRNSYGILGDNTVTSRSSPVSLVAPCNTWTWKQVNTGQNHCLAIKSDDTLWAWGYNAYGQLGDNTATNKSSPISVVGGFTWKQMSGSRSHTVAIKSDDTLWSWGRNNYGQLGDNVGTISSRSSPVSVVGGFTWKQVNAGWHNVIAMRSDDTLWAWGRNNYGQLGDNTATNKSSPVSVVGGFIWKQVCSGTGNHSGAIKSDNTLWAWGRNNYGQLGDNTTTNRSSPVSVIGGFTWKNASTGYNSTIGIQIINR